MVRRRGREGRNVKGKGRNRERGRKKGEGIMGWEAERKQREGRELIAVLYSLHPL